ncbi:SH3 domain-containing protein [Xanthomonas sp. 3075]|uniref:SH3 domain-containing protein n=1 Tax=Xanthomonas sp. 3075 TaxID=3035315 RepID=UPI0021A4CAC1|nr:SH3 domain-containing protein [Xanthomonas sp. 3075]
MAVAFPVAAQQAGHANRAVGLHAGPDAQYRRVGDVQPGGALKVYGCLKNGAWCDVRSPDSRGWMPAQAIALDRGSVTRVVPVVPFSLDTYWDTHYRGREWTVESERAYWRRHEPGTPLAPGMIARPAEASVPPPTLGAAPPPQWVPPGERMYQAPPPDVVKRNREREARESDARIQRERKRYENDPPQTGWWPPRPYQLQDHN